MIEFHWIFCCDQSRVVRLSEGIGQTDPSSSESCKSLFSINIRELCAPYLTDQTLRLSKCKAGASALVNLSRAAALSMHPEAQQPAAAEDVRHWSREQERPQTACSSGTATFTSAVSGAARPCSCGTSIMRPFHAFLYLVSAWGCFALYNIKQFIVICLRRMLFGHDDLGQPGGVSRPHFVTSGSCVADRTVGDRILMHAEHRGGGAPAAGLCF